MNYPIKTLQQLRPILVGFRKEAGLSQAAVASLLGVSQQSYAKIEANPSTTSVERLFIILRLLGAEIVLTRSDTSNKSTAVEPVEPPLPATRLAQPLADKPKTPAPRKLLPPTLKTEDW